MLDFFTAKHRFSLCGAFQHVQYSSYQAWHHTLTFILFLFTNIEKAETCVHGFPVNFRIPVVT